jgi:hypothetical protein
MRASLAISAQTELPADFMHSKVLAVAPFPPLLRYLTSWAAPEGTIELTARSDVRHGSLRHTSYLAGCTHQAVPNPLPRPLRSSLSKSGGATVRRRQALVLTLGAERVEGEGE